MKHYDLFKYNVTARKSVSKIIKMHLTLLYYYLTFISDINDENVELLRKAIQI